MPVFSFAESLQAPRSSFIGDEVFEKLLGQSEREGWARLPIGEVVGRIGLALVGTPYVGHTLELSDNEEICAINLEGLDCVTLFECSLDLARVIKMGHPSKRAFIDAVRQTRYRGGHQGGYVSRLHYTSDWIWDNERRHIVRDITPTLTGAEVVTRKVGFMSTHPEDYRQLKANPNFVPQIKGFEDRINRRKTCYLPMEHVAENEHLLLTGDIIGVTTDEPGIDIEHTGLCYRSEDGALHFLDASSLRRNMKVTLEGPLNRSILWSKRNTGIVVARPLEPRT